MIAATSMVMLVSCAGSQDPPGPSTVKTEADDLEVTELEAEAIIEVGEAPQSPAIGFGSVWVSNHHSASVTRIDPETNDVIATMKTGKWSGGISFDSDSVWVMNYDAEFISRIDPETNEVTNLKTPAVGCGAAAPIESWIWACQVPPIGEKGPSYIGRFDAQSGSIGRKFEGLGFPAVGFDSLWIAAPDDGLLYKLDPENGEERGRVEIDSPETLVFAGDSILVGTSGAIAKVVRIDPATLATQDIFPSDDDSFSNLPEPAVEGDNVWIFDTFETIFRLDMTSTEVEPVATVPRAAGAAPSGFAVGFGSFWITDFNEGVVNRFDVPD